MRDEEGTRLFLSHKYNSRKPINKASFDDEHNHVLKKPNMYINITVKI
jgi:hypothetical protein